MEAIKYINFFLGFIVKFLTFNLIWEYNNIVQMVDLQEKKENRKIKKSQTCIIFIFILQKKRSVGPVDREIKLVSPNLQFTEALRHT